MYWESQSGKYTYMYICNGATAYLHAVVTNNSVFLSLQLSPSSHRKTYIHISSATHLISLILGPYSLDRRSNNKHYVI